MSDKEEMKSYRDEEPEPPCEAEQEQPAQTIPPLMGGMGASLGRSGPIPNDPWAHRSSGMLCVTCMWWIQKTPAGAIVGPNGALGRCKRHSPTNNGYPPEFASGWCGDHRLDENKF